MQNELTAERIEEAKSFIEHLTAEGLDCYDCFYFENCDTSCPKCDRATETALAALRAEQERQWISVEDRLPNMCGCKCLVAAINQFGQKDVFTAFTGYMEHGKLEFHSCEPTHEITAWTITHWMPLPEPPADCGRRLTEGESK